MSGAGGAGCIGLVEWGDDNGRGVDRPGWHEDRPMKIVKMPLMR